MIIDLLPDDVIEDILIENYIYNAQPVSGDKNMLILMIIWRTYIEPEIQVNCNLCLNRILQNWKELQDQMIKRIQNNRLLEN